MKPGQVGRVGERRAADRHPRAVAGLRPGNGGVARDQPLERLAAARRRLVLGPVGGQREGEQLDRVFVRGDLERPGEVDARVAVAFEQVVAERQPALEEVGVVALGRVAGDLEADQLGKSVGHRGEEEGLAGRADGVQHQVLVLQAGAVSGAAPARRFRARRSRGRWSSPAPRRFCRPSPSPRPRRARGCAPSAAGRSAGGRPVSIADWVLRSRPSWRSKPSASWRASASGKRARAVADAFGHLVEVGVGPLAGRIGISPRPGIVRDALVAVVLAAHHAGRVARLVVAVDENLLAAAAALAALERQPVAGLEPGETPGRQPVAHQAQLLVGALKPVLGHHAVADEEDRGGLAGPAAGQGEQRPSLRPKRPGRGRSRWPPISRPGSAAAPAGARSSAAASAARRRCRRCRRCCPARPAGGGRAGRWCAPPD